MEWKTLAIVIMAFAALGVSLMFAGQAPAVQGNGSSASLSATPTAAATVVPTQAAQPSAVQSAVQDVYVKALSGGVYDHPSITVNKGTKVRFHFTADKGAGCGSQLFIPEFGVQLSSQNGQEAVAEFTPTSAGTFPFRCGMNMFRGTITVK